ncbi:hypothetical protein EV361DRAFT_812418, partial [Lentinula raphanica]
QVYFSAEYADDTEKAIHAMLDTIRQPQGVHPQLAHILKRTLDDVKRVGGDMIKEKKRRTMPRTWKDSNSTTLYMD